MKEKFIQILAEICFFEPKEVTFNLSIEEDLAISSVMMVELATELEKAFGISLELQINKLINCETVGDMYRMIENLYQHK